MKRNCCTILLLLSLAVGLCKPYLSAAATVKNPYQLIAGGSVIGVEMHNEQNLQNAATYYTATVTSHMQGELTREAIPYLTHGIIGSADTKLFVSSLGTSDHLDFTTATVKSIVEQFEKDNPAWNAVAAVNGDFFDIETSLTACYGEPEGAMIQQGAVYKGDPSDARGRGLVGTTADGTVVYHTIGDIYKEKGYGIPFNILSYHTLQILGENRTNAIASYTVHKVIQASNNQPIMVTPDDNPCDLSGYTVCAVKCDVYRRAHIGINGLDKGTQGYFFEGEIVEVTSGKSNSKPSKGIVWLALPDADAFPLLKTGVYVRCQKALRGDWTAVENAVGFKQQVLAEGDILLKNCYGTYNQKGDKDETLKWTDDIYDYPFCWKHRTAIGFREDGTPILLVIEKSSHADTYKGIAASYYEIGEQFLALGCVNGFLLDGGGSSTLVIRQPDGTFANAFVGEGSGRKVANAVILAVRDESVELPKNDSPLENNIAPDRNHTVNDALRLVKAITSGETQSNPSAWASSDYDIDGIITINDVFALIDRILGFLR